MSVSIPLSEQTINIKIDYNKINESNVIEGMIKNPNAKKYLIISGINIVLDLICLMVIISTLIKLNTKKTLYIKNKNRILKEYDKVLVSTETIPNLDRYQIIKVTSFEEMLDARDTLESNILYIETIKNYQSLFIIIKDDLAYIYELNDSGDVNGK